MSIYHPDLTCQHVLTFSGRQVPSGPLPALFAQMEWGTDSELWDEEADLTDALRYVRGSKLLKIPLQWREVLPTEV